MADLRLFARLKLKSEGKLTVQISSNLDKWARDLSIDC